MDLTPNADAYVLPVPVAEIKRPFYHLYLWIH